MAKILKETTPLDVLRHCRELGLDTGLLASCLGVSGKTIGRWEKGAVEPGLSARRNLEKLEATYQVIKKLLRKKAWQTWLHSPNETLSGERPIELLRRGEIERVREALGMIEWGIYS
jgi:predicted transcriptional regulator